MIADYKDYKDPIAIGFTDIKNPPGKAEEFLFVKRITLVKHSDLCQGQSVLKHFPQVLQQRKLFSPGCMADSSD